MDVAKSSGPLPDLAVAPSRQLQAGELGCPVSSTTYATKSPDWGYRPDDGYRQNSVSSRDPPDRGHGDPALPARAFLARERLFLLGLHDHAHQPRWRDRPAQDAPLAHHRRTRPPAGGARRGRG